MIVSMTGYGRESVTSATHTVTVEIKTVNHRFSEIAVHLPRTFLMFEDQVRQMIKQYVQRGKTDIYISIDGEGLFSSKLEVDWDLLGQYVQAKDEAARRFDLSSKGTASDLLHVPDAFRIVEQDADWKGVKETLIEAVGGAAEKLLDMRKLEGAYLHDDLLLRLKVIQSSVEKLIERAPHVISEYRLRLHKKVEDYIEGQLNVEDERLLTEVAAFADKADIDEELTRLRSHIKQFASILSDGGVVGRKLNFLLQEMNREVNTIGAKGNDFNISFEVVEIKSELEKMKEQIQNVE